MSLQAMILDLCVDAREASRQLARIPLHQIDKALVSMADELDQSKANILEANAQDVKAAELAGIATAMIDRLKLDDKRFASMVNGLRQVASLPNPLGETLKEWTRPNGLSIRQIRVPIGVIGIIYESRPNVTVDAGVLCLKTGNAVILRGGSESFHSNTALVQALQAGAKRANLPAACIQLVPTTDRAAITELCHQDAFVDLLIPRGGEGLIRAVTKEARMPVIKHYNGICHVYVHSEADLAMAEAIIINAKCQRPGVCNALETLLVDKAIAQQFLPQIGKALNDKRVEIVADAYSASLLGVPSTPATDESWGTEYLELKLSLKTVDSLTDAIDHIERHGSHHSDSIITSNESVAQKFLTDVDSATVYWNASTRFTDGGEFGFGAEIGISTDKIHARGPMGLAELTSYKYQITGSGQVRP